MKIKILDPLVATKIAAGEVIERPSSVIKELVENSIDANSSNIEIEIINGGMDLIKIIDNGNGILKEDLPLAITRHATSKINDLNDLLNLTSMGFRGEALASIAAVSQMQISSKSIDSQLGTEMQIENSTILSQNPISMTHGTSIVVNNLFFNLPARKKFMSSDKSESNKISRLINHFAVSHPEIKFRLSIDGKEKLNTFGDGELKHTISKILNQNLANDFLPISTKGKDYEISGYISPPHITRTNRSNILYSVNKRIVKDKLITMAIEQAFKGFLTIGKFPLTVLDISTDPSLIDINVHPRKDEVRFLNEKDIFSFIQKSIRETIVQQHPVPNTFNYNLKPPYPFNIGSTGKINYSENSETITQKVFALSENEEAYSTIDMSFPILRAIGQIDNTYIIAEGPEGMYILDQHASHEKINYEKILDAIGSNHIEVQYLMEPCLIDTSHLKSLYLTHKLTTLNNNGILIDSLDDQTLVLKGIPGSILNNKLNEFIKDIELFLEQNLDINDALGTITSIAASIACHSSIRAGDTMDISEIHLLVRNLEKCSEPYHCPHGRPTISNISIQQLNRMFIRPDQK